MERQDLRPGRFVKFLGSWGEIVLLGGDFVFLSHWRGQLTATAPIDELTEVKSDQRLHWDERRSLGRRLNDHYAS